MTMTKTMTKTKTRSPLHTVLPSLAALFAVAALPAADDFTIGHWGTTTLVVSAPGDGSDAAVSAKLQTTMKVAFQEASIDDVAAVIRQATGVNIIIDPAVRTRNPIITLSLNDVTAANVLSWCAKIGGFKTSFENQAVVIADTLVASPQKIVLYDVADLVATPRDFNSPLAEQTYLPLSTGGGAGAKAPILFPVANTAPTNDSPEQRLAALEEQIRRMLAARAAGN